MLNMAEVALRLGIATLAGGALGLNRDLHGKATGLRTLAIVALATSSIIVITDNGDAAKLTDAASRMIQGILTGAGFLGAGVIIHADPKARVHGLTSAACTWLTACLGILCGCGHWRIVAVALAITFVVLMFGGKLERALHGTFFDHRRRRDSAFKSPTDAELVSHPRRHDR